MLCSPTCCQGKEPPDCPPPAATTNAGPSRAFPGGCPHCIAKPGAADHVCGADGITYENTCYARCYGVQVVRAGPCAPPPAVRKLMQDGVLAADGAVEDLTPPVDQASAQATEGSLAGLTADPAAASGSLLEPLVALELASNVSSRRRPPAQVGALSTASVATPMVSPQAVTCTQAALYVARPNCNADKAIWFAAVYLEVSTSSCSSGRWRYR